VGIFTKRNKIIDLPQPLFSHPYLIEEDNQSQR
jgi:hypothetical protein